MAKWKTTDDIPATAPLCRLVSLSPESDRGPSENQLEVRKAVAAAALVALLGFASMGVVFTLKQRQAKPDSQTGVVFASETPNHVPPPNPITPKPKAVVPTPSATALPEPPPAVPTIKPTPGVNETEYLAILPRESNPAPPKNASGPTQVAIDKPRDPSVEPTREPDLPVTTIPDVPPEKPVVQAPKKFPDTQPAIDPRLKTFGTRIGFHPTAADAIEATKKDKDKLVMVVHYAGLFEVGSFRSGAAEEFRSGCLLNDDVVSAVQQNFVCSATKISSSRNLDDLRNSGSVVTYFCRRDGAVLHAIPGPASAEEFLREVNWMLETRKTAIVEHQKDPPRYAATFKKAHTERFFVSAGDDPLLPGAFPMLPKGPGGMGPFGGFPPFGGLPFGGLPGNPFIDPFPMMPGQPQQPQKLPSKCPADLNPQAKVHWLLGWKPLPQLTDIYRRVYTEFLKDSIIAP